MRHPPPCDTGLTYLDIGANTPVVQSNSWFMDQCLGWRGVCAEPNPALARKIRNSVRTCTVYNGCVSDKPGELFLQGYSGMSVVGEVSAKSTQKDAIRVPCASVQVLPPLSIRFRPSSINEPVACPWCLGVSASNQQQQKQPRHSPHVVLRPERQSPVTPN